MTYETPLTVRTLLQTVRSQRHVLLNFVSRDLKVKYRGTVLGYLWSLLEPLSLVLVYYFVFEVIARRGGEGYPLIVILGVLPYNFMGSIVSSGAVALTSNASLIRRVYMPREVFVLSATASNFVVFALSMIAVIPFMVVYGVLPGWKLLMLPGASLLMLLLGTGLAFIAACANALFRDVGYVIRVLLRLFFYGSPTIYPVTMVPESVRDYYLLNPVSIAISMVRSSIMNTPLAFGFEYVAFATACSLFVFWAGYHLFRRWQSKAVKYL